MIKLTSLNAFDKGFFGKTLVSGKSVGKISKPSNLKQDSVDDLLAHFDLFKNPPKLEKMPAKDSFNRYADTQLPEIF